MIFISIQINHNILYLYYQTDYMKEEVCVLIYLFCLTAITEVGCQTYNITGLVPANSSTLSVNFTVSNQSKSAAILFKIYSSAYSNLVILADNEPIPALTITPQVLSNYYLQNHTLLQQMDIQRAISGYDQLINIKYPTGTTTLYFMIYNLDLPNIVTNKNFMIQIKVSNRDNTVCYQCQIGGSRPNQDCQCPCPQNTYGPACEFNQKTLVLNDLYNVTFYRMANLYFRIVNPPDTIVITFDELTKNNNTTLYIQYQVVVGAIAGYLNTYYDSNNQPFAYLITSQAKSIVVPTKGKNLSLTLACRQLSPTMIQMKYSQPSRGISDLALELIIGLGVGIPVSLVMLFIGLYCIYCRRLHSNSPKNSLANQYMLTIEQINRYLPEVPSTIVLKKSLKMEQSRQTMMREGEHEEKEDNANQCCICLTQIGENEKIRVGYCRHYFHSKCLMGWFAKNQSCPYCRMEFNYGITLAEYLKIRKQGPDLADSKLVQAILGQHHQEQKHQEYVKEQKMIMKDKDKAEVVQQRQNEGQRQVQQNQMIERRYEARQFPSLQAITPSLDAFEID